MLLYSSPEPDPCCVWSWAEKPSLYPAGPGFCSGLCFSAVHLLIESFWFIVSFVLCFMGMALSFPCSFVGNSEEKVVWCLAW